ncbi:hypothetical protein F0P96_16380 [Hymenobacter busanensis]|uniref:Uncharacterized protein n=1 Tax=Hymenobacter busanensis TaxID=2607656 RepID=A0A7L4ZTG2_9BACT|nr:hypothetical protein [Hymenobacter busanensis]KAA9327557.1 hypothetical protein F0P96_16380 [Hymenobacter busanensis]QHJ06105.1 hypothetical protein GUY19_01855 [Hymenobacter busanensis]
MLRNNLLILLGSAVLLGALAKMTDNGSTVLFALGYSIQALVNLLLGTVALVAPKRIGRSAAPYFLSALLILIIGFGACAAMFSVGGGLGNMH